MIEVRAARPADAAVWERMRQALWPSERGEHDGEIAAFFAGHRPNDAETLIAFDAAGAAVGFAELAIRNRAEGCTSERVAYLEGWFVEPHARRRGAGAALVRAAEVWGRERGCTEFASDTEIDNEVSAAAHRALGFTEVGRAICFAKRL